MISYNEIMDDIQEFTLYNPEEKEIEAYFSNGRLDKSTLPEGKFAYELREGDDGYIAALEEKVLVNFAGTIITDEEIEIPESGFIDLSDDNETGWGYSF